MAIGPDPRKAYLIGGAGLGDLDADLYEIDLDHDQWRRVTATGEPPPSFQGASLTFNEANKVLVLAGGLRCQPPGKATISDVWVFDPSTSQWDRTDGGETLRRRDHMAAYCRTTKEHILIGGRVSQTVGNFFGRSVPAAKNVAIKVVDLSAH